MKYFFNKSEFLYLTFGWRCEILSLQGRRKVVFDCLQRSRGQTRRQVFMKFRLKVQMPNNAPSSYLMMTSLNFLLNIVVVYLKNGDSSRFVYFLNLYMKNGWLYQTCISLLKKIYGIFNILVLRSVRIVLVSLEQLANSQYGGLESGRRPCAG